MNNFYSDELQKRVCQFFKKIEEPKMSKRREMLEENHEDKSQEMLDALHMQDVAELDKQIAEQNMAVLEIEQNLDMLYDHERLSYQHIIDTKNRLALAQRKLEQLEDLRDELF